MTGPPSRATGLPSSTAGGLDEGGGLDAAGPPSSTAGGLDGPVVVMGVSGCGKSRIASLLAQTLGAHFLDADDVHSLAAIAKMATGQPLDDDDRTPWLHRLAERLDADPTLVLACSALKRAYRDVLRTASGRLCFLHLSGDREVIAARLASRQDHFMPASLLDSQFVALEPLAPDEFGVQIDCTQTPQHIVEEFLARMSARL